MYSLASTRRPVLSLLLLAASFLSADFARAAVTPLPSLAEPALSPDGSEIAFVSGGDIWTVSSQGGPAHLLVTDPATESRPIYSPDGARLAFLSTRSGTANIYILTFATGELQRLTYSDVSEQLDAWSRDGKWIYFSSSINDVARQNDIFRVSVAGGTPLEVSRERYLNEFESAPSPDGQSIALMAKGLSNVQWWRNGHSHIDETELWLKPIAADGKYQRLLPPGAKHAWPMWEANGKSLYYMSDESGSENIWQLPIGGDAHPRQITRFTSGRLLWPSIGYDSKSIVFERHFSIWKLDTASGEAKQVPINLHGAPASAGDRHLVESEFTNLALSPDGKKIAVIAHGEVFAASAKDGGEAQRITHTDAVENDLHWSPDSNRLLYLSERTGQAHLYEYDFTTSTEHALTSAAGEDTSPSYSPDGKMIAYVHANKELHVLTLPESRKGTEATDRNIKDRVVTTGPIAGYDDSPLAWSPDSQWIAYLLTDHKSFRNVSVVPAAGGESRPVSFLANGETGSNVAWSPDGKYLIFDTAQRSEDAKLVRVDLLPHTPKYREDAFRELFKPAETPDKPAAPSTTDHPAAPPTPDTHADKPDTSKADQPANPKDKKKPEPVKIVFEGIRERATILPLGLDSEFPVISPDGKTLVFRARQNGQSNLYTWSLDELAKEPPVAQQLTSTRRGKSDYAFTPDSKDVFYLEGGVVHTVAVESHTSKAVPVTATMEINFDVEKNIVFEEAWSTLNRRFFDSTFNGHDWARLHDEWAPYIAGTHTPDEMRRDINLLIGELNSSHSGINRPQDSPGSQPVVHVGDLGLRFDREAYEAKKGLVIREVIALGPAAIEGTIKPGETLLAINGEAVGPTTNLNSLLQDEVGKRVVLSIGAANDPAKKRDAIVRPVSTAVAAGLLYRQWVNDRRAYVEKISDGKLGYVHIPDMSDQSLAQLYLDLDAQNEARQGVVIDIRNNNGGYINGYALDVFTRKNFLMMTPRDLFSLPSRQSLGQRALGLPTVLVINESSLSDAEDFTEGYRSLGLGKVVGEPTAGWIIYTGGEELIDGSVVRVPFIRVQDLRGQTMEMHPRPVDLEVERPLGESLAGTDAQLEAAVKELLQSVK